MGLADPRLGFGRSDFIPKTPRGHPEPRAGRAFFCGMFLLTAVAVGAEVGAMNHLPLSLGRRVLPYLAVGMVVVAGSMRAAMVILNPTADTTLQSAFPNDNFGDGTSFQAGGRRNGGAARGLLLFDIAGSIPSGSTINSVSLTLTVTATPSGGVNSIFDLHRLTASWGEGAGSDFGGSAAAPGESTWNARFAPGTLWASPGGDFSATVSASRAIAGNGNYTFTSTANLIADVQAWLNSPAINFGWLLDSQSENTPTTIRRFGNRTSGSTSPLLTIQYTPVPEPGVLPLAALGVTLTVLLRKRSKPA